MAINGVPGKGARSILDAALAAVASVRPLHLLLHHIQELSCHGNGRDTCLTPAGMYAALQLEMIMHKFLAKNPRSAILSMFLLPCLGSLVNASQQLEISSYLASRKITLLHRS